MTDTRDYTPAEEDFNTPNVPRSRRPWWCILVIIAIFALLVPFIWLALVMWRYFAG
ncbi:MAG: hypothetical protein ACOCXT_00170 [Candidatus Dojkabacteria bacterium]